MRDMIGNRALWQRRKLGFLASSEVAPLSVLPTLDWALDVSAREDVSVVSGFSSAIEKDVLSVLLRGKCGIILVLARKMYKELPAPWSSLLGSGRLLIISTSAALRQTKESAVARNRYICSSVERVYMPSVPSEASSLHRVYVGLGMEKVGLIHSDAPRGE